MNIPMQMHSSRPTSFGTGPAYQVPWVNHHTLLLLFMGILFSVIDLILVVLCIHIKLGMHISSPSKNLVHVV